MNVKKLCMHVTEIISNSYLKESTVCKSCYNMKKGKNNVNTLIKNQQP